MSNNASICLSYTAPLCATSILYCIYILDEKNIISYNFIQKNVESPQISANFKLRFL